LRITFIAWTRYDRHSELLAQHLDAGIHFIYYGQGGALLQAPVRYLVQALRTWRVLRRDNPDVIFVQNPPIFCALVAFIYSRRYGARYVIDSHTGAFDSPKWRWSVSLHRMLSSAALATIVHNRFQEEMVKRWGCRYLVLGYRSGNHSSTEHYPLGKKFNVAVPCSFHADEPLDVVFEAASLLPKVDFHLTGDANRAAPRLLEKKPDNCHLTGFLPYDRYLGLLSDVDVVLDLTTRDQVVLSGGFEAVFLGKPLIVSDWPILRECYPLGTLHISNTVEGVYEGVRRAQDEHETLQQDILRLRDLLEKEWKQKMQDLKEILRKA